ncbi:hypothetical protein D3C80_1453470 [compost metagenome]
MGSSYVHYSLREYAYQSESIFGDESYVHKLHGCLEYDSVPRLLPKYAAYCRRYIGSTIADGNLGGLCLCQIAVCGSKCDIYSVSCAGYDSA